MNRFDLNTINPYIRIRWYTHPMPKGREKGPRLGFDFELGYVNQGQLLINYADNNYIIEAGNFFFIQPNIKHTISSPDTDSSYGFIHFDFIYSPHSPIRPYNVLLKDIDKNDPRLINTNLLTSSPLSPIIQFTDMEMAKKLFWDVTRIENYNQRGDILNEKGVFLQLLNMLLKDNYPDIIYENLHLDMEIAQMIKEYIDTGKAFSEDLSDLENEFSFSRFYMEKQFKKAYGVSIIAYKNSKRFEIAHLLLQTESVSKVAEKLGYSSIFAFSRAFKKHFGYNPSDVKHK